MDERKNKYSYSVCRIQGNTIQSEKTECIFFKKAAIKITVDQIKNLFISILLTIPCILFAQENLDNYLISAFIVNDDMSGDAEQTFPEIAIDSTGKIMMTWLDSRTGDLNIYLRRFNQALQPLDADQRVNDDPGLADQAYPVIAVQASGVGMVVWEDWRDESSNIYMQLFSQEGQKIGANQRVNDDVIDLQSQHIDPAVISTDSTFLIAWSDNRTGDFQIMLQAYNLQAQPIGNNVSLSESVQGYGYHRYPCLATWNKDTLLVGWQAMTGNVNDIYFGKIHIAQPGVIAPLLIADGQYPHIASHFNKDAALVWISDMQTEPKMNARIFDDHFQLNTSIIQKEIALDELHREMFCLFPSQDTYCLVWERQEEKDLSLYFQVFQSDGWKGNAVRLPVSDRSGSQHCPHGLEWDQKVYCCWQDHANYNADIGISTFTTEHPSDISELWVNSSKPASDQKVPHVSMNTNSQCMIVWEDMREGYQDIYGQLYNANLEPIGQNIRINSNQGSRHQHYPDVSMNASGESVVVWRTDKSESTDIIAQRFSAQGTRVGDPVVLNDYPSTLSQNFPRVAMGDDGVFLVVWREWINNNFDIVYQFVDQNNVKLGGNTLLNDDVENASQWQPSVSTDGQGLFITAWEDDREGSVDIFGQLLKAEGKIGVNVPVYADTVQFQGTPSVDMNAKGEFVVAWRDNRQYIAKVFYQRFHPDFSRKGMEIQVETDAQVIQKDPCIDISDQGQINLSWLDYSEGDAVPVLKLQRFDVSDLPLESTWTYDNGYTYYHDLCMNDQKCVLVWQDNTRQLGWDICAKPFVYGVDDVKRSEHEKYLFSRNSLIQISPNPFNYQTQIKINLPEYQSASLWLYNARGQLVYHWVISDIRREGYRIFWDGCDQFGHALTSGVYVLKLHALNKVFNYKIVLMK